LDEIPDVNAIPTRPEVDVTDDGDDVDLARARASALSAEGGGPRTQLGPGVSGINIDIVLGGLAVGGVGPRAGAGLIFRVGGVVVPVIVGGGVVLMVGVGGVVLVV
jgi:hypothetical protein